MKEIKMEELKSIQLDILKDIHSFCEKNQLRYYLFYGTLLGAIRHKGYIPWDDDIDIAMPRPDYEKFFSMFGNNKYEAQNCTNTKKYPYSFGKVFDNRTVLKENISFTVENGVYVDIFPLDGLPEDKQKIDKIINKIKIWRYILNLKKNKIFNCKRTIPKQLFFIFLQMFVIVIPYRFVVNKINNLCKFYAYDSCELVAELNAGNNNSMIHRSAFDKTIMIDFEKYKFMAPCGYDEWLTNRYGDYMQAPPIKDRISTHKYKAWWK